MRTLAIALLAVLPVRAAVINASRQDPVILKAYVDGVPTTLALYSAHVCGTGPGEERLTPDTVLFAAADFGAVQDSGSALFAAVESKKKSKRYRLVTVLINGVEYFGYAVAGLSTGGVIMIPKAVTTALLGVSAITPKLVKRKEELAYQPKPPGWIEPGMEDRIISPQKCPHFTFLMDSETPKTFKASIAPIFIQNVPAAQEIPRVLEPTTMIPFEGGTPQQYPTLYSDDIHDAQENRLRTMYGYAAYVPPKETKPQMGAPQ